MNVLDWAELFLQDISHSVITLYFRIPGLAFANAGTYDPYNFGKKLQRFYNCDIYLTDANFEELVVDLEVVLILQPLIRRRPGINNCDQPLITRQTVRIEFEGYQSTVCYHLLHHFVQLNFLTVTLV